MAICGWPAYSPQQQSLPNGRIRSAAELVGTVKSIQCCLHMTRTFTHIFEGGPSPVSTQTVDLDVREIEDAGIKEVLQTSGARVTTWSIIDSLLQPGEQAFRFREPLGAARETKVAISGL